MADTKVTDLTANTAPISTDLLYVVDDPAGTPLGQKATLLDVVAGSLLASQLCNEIKGWPPVVNTGDLDALGLWWDKVSTPSTAPSVVALSGEGITETWELALKVVADGANEGLSQRFTYADEPRVKVGRRLSTLWAIWCVGGVGATLSIVNSSSEETAAAKVTAAAWTIVEVPNHLLAGTYCDIKIISDGAGTFYAVPLGANIGARAFALRPRGLRYVANAVADVVGADPGATWTDVDLTANTSPLAARAHLSCAYSNTSAADKSLGIRRNGDTATGNSQIVVRGVTTNHYYIAQATVYLDDAQIFEYIGSDVAANTEICNISLVGYWEWE